GRVEVQLVLDATAAAADDAQTQIDLLGEALVRLAVLGDDAFDGAGGLLGHGNRHSFSPVSDTGRQAGDSRPPARHSFDAAQALAVSGCRWPCSCFCW